MSTFYLLASKFDRFHSEVSFCRNRASSICSECRYPRVVENRTFEYFWDTEFGKLDRSLAAEHDVFWCELSMLVRTTSIESVKNTSLPIGLIAAQCLTPSEVLERYDMRISSFSGPELMVAMASTNVSIAGDSNHTQVCKLCGKFKENAWKIAGLTVKRNDAETAGMFRIAQNRGQPTFVTQEARIVLEKSGLLGIAFYPAGKLVD